MSVRSKCINCGKQRACLKVEARAPLREPVLVPTYNPRTDEAGHRLVEYEEHGTMVEICRKCMREDHGVLARFLLEGELE